MYSEIAANRRRTVIFIGLFFLTWLAIGAVAGLLFKAFYHPTMVNSVGEQTEQPVTRDHEQGDEEQAAHG